MDNYGIYPSREEAGKILAEKIAELNLDKPCLLAIPRGGIQVAKAIADTLKVPIYPAIVKKLPVPGNPEAGFGAVAPDGTKVLDDKTISYIGLSKDMINRIAARIMEEVKHRTQIYGAIELKKIRDSDAIVVDDGVATGYSLFTALKYIRNMKPKSLTAAVPVSTKEAHERLKLYADNVICPLVDESYFFAVANYYKEWYDLTEEEIKRILTDYQEKYGD